MVVAINLIFVLYVVSTILFWDWELSSHEVDAIQTMKHKVWHGNDSNRAELVELFPTTTQRNTSTFKLWLAKYKNGMRFIECGTTIWKMVWILYYLHCWCYRFYFTIVSNINKQFVRFINGIECSELTIAIVWNCTCSMPFWGFCTAHQIHCQCENFNCVVLFHLKFSELIKTIPIQ